MNQQLESIQVKETTDELEIDLIELLYFFRSKIVLLILTMLAGGLLAGVFTYYFITPKYTATAKMYMVSASSDSIIDITDLNLGTSLSSDYEEMIKIRPIFEDVIEENQLPYTYEELLDLVSISTIADTRILTISAESTLPSEAQVIANALAEAAVERLPKLMDTSKPNIAEHAIVPIKKSSPNYSMNIMIGAFGTLVVVLALLTFLFVTDDTLKSAEDVEKILGIMPLTVIPEGNIGNASEKQEQEKGRRQKRRKKS